MTADEYKKAWNYYKKHSQKVLLWIVVLMAVILIWLLLNNFFFLGIVSTTQSFFLFISLLSLCIGAALQANYRLLMKDPLSDLSDFVVAKTAKQLDAMIEKNRKRIYDSMVLFWIGSFCFVIAVILIFFSAGEDNKNKADDGRLELSLLQINDVYEIAALDSGRIGGMARIATLKKQMLKQNKNTMLLMAGDFISPSIFNSVKKNGETIFGKQMIEAMNLSGVDLAIFGNHEFDGSFATLQKRINESRFEWVASNISHVISSGNVLFTQNNIDIPKWRIKKFTDADGTSFTVGFFGLTLPDNKGSNPEFAAYDSALNTAKKMYTELAKSCDAVIAVTHQEMNDDRMLAMEIPQLAAIIGGHEHDMQYEKIGNVHISKAHANARSAFHLRILYDKNSSPKVNIIPDLVSIDTATKPDFFTKSVSDKWMDVAMNYFRDSGFSPEKIICENFFYKLDGGDAAVRSKPTNLTRLITDAMLDATKNSGTTIAILNAGSIRVDDIIAPPITEYDILRAMPYGGAIRIAKMKGFFIKEIINKATQYKNEGAFLQYSYNLDKPNLSINTLADSTSYNVAIADFLIEGRQKNFEKVKEGTFGIDNVSGSPSARDSSQYDVRKAVIKYLEKSCRNGQKLDKYK